MYEINKGHLITLQVLHAISLRDALYINLYNYLL